MPEHYNFIFIISDQHRKDAAGCYGHPIVKTPHLDKLAARGILFSQAYCPSPLCGPSRGALWTGQHCRTSNAMTQYTQIFEHAPLIAEEFRAAGYHTASIGKTHVVGETDERDLGFDERALRYYTFKRRDYIAEIGEENVNKYAWNREFGEGAYNTGNTPVELPDEMMFDSLVVEKTKAYLQEHKDDPFFLNVGIEKPHPDWYCPEEYHQMYKPEDVILPDNFNQPLENVPQSMVKRQEYLESHTFSEEKVRHAIAAYYANCTYMDNCIGRILDYVDELGLTENTVIVYTSDHGEILFEHGWTQKHCMFESAVAVPLICANSNLFPEGKVQPGIVNLIDLFPTFMDVIQREHPEGLEGNSLLPLIQGEEDSQGRETFSEYYWTCPPSRMIRNDSWKYVYTHEEIPQLYDMVNDPGEKNNLALDPEYKTVCAELESKVLDGWDIPDIDIDMTARESRYKIKEEYMRKVKAGLDPDSGPTTP